MTRGGNRPSAPWVAPDQRRGEVRCPLCDARNGAAAAFCRWCGTPLGRPTDPVLGITTRRAGLNTGGNRMSGLVGAIAGIALVGIAAWAILGGGLSGATSILGPGGSASSAPSARVSPSGPNTPSSPRPSVQPSNGSSPSGSLPAPTSSPPSASPSAVPTLAPTATPPPATGFTCDPIQVTDASSASWRLARTRWGPRGDYDQLAFVLERRSGSGSGGSASVSVEQVASDQVQSRFGLPAPAGGDRAVVVTFRGPISGSQFLERPALDVIEEVRIDNDADGVLRAVVGVTGEGCYRLSAPSWAFASAPQDVDIILDVRKG